MTDKLSQILSKIPWNIAVGHKGKWAKMGVDYYSLARRGSSLRPISRSQNVMTSVAAVDRLPHHGIVFEMNIDSYRLQKSKEKEITDDTIKTVEN